MARPRKTPARLRGKSPPPRLARDEDEEDAREAVVVAALALSALGLSPGRSGNVSLRYGAGMLITPTGMVYDEIDTDDVVFIADDGSAPRDRRKPSSEWHFHQAIYRARPDCHGVVHTHSMHATVLACAHRPIPAFHYMVAVAGGSDIPLVPYATFGTPELADYVAIGLKDRNACLLANHGMIAIGTELGFALELASEVEILAEQYCKVLALGSPHILPAAEMERVLEKFKNYGQKGQG
jgi:L-fuculose-phosphate aldolase